MTLGIGYKQHEARKVLFCWLMVNRLRSSVQFGLQLNAQEVEKNSDLFRETFVLFDLDIDLFFTTEVTKLADQAAQATPTTIISDPSKGEDGPLSLRWE